MNALSDLQLRVADRVLKVRAKKIALREAKEKRAEAKAKEKAKIRPEPPLELVVAQVTFKMKVEAWFRHSRIGRMVWGLFHKNKK